MSEAVGLRGITKSYGSLKVLDDVTVSIPGGVFAVILGPSGCGKSTLLGTITGLVRPERGEIYLGGHAIDCCLPPEARGLGVMFQEPALFPHLTVFENVAFPLRVRGASDSEVQRAVEAMLELARLANEAQRLPRALSGGQLQRAALCRALVFGPSVVLLDEPLSSLDRPLRESLQRDLVNMQRRTGATFLMVTHDREEAMNVSDLILIMSQGRIVQAGSPAQLFRQPESRFVAEFFVGCRVLGGDVRVSSGGWHVAGPNGLSLHTGRGEPPQVKHMEVAIRPDQVRVDLPGAGRKDVPAASPATVEEIRFAGPVLMLSLSLGQHRLAAQVKAADFEELKIGDQVDVRIETAHTVPLSPPLPGANRTAPQSAVAFDMSTTA